MDTPSNYTLHLLDEIKKMNKNLETASAAINDLTMQLHKSADALQPPSPPQHALSGNTTNTAQATTCIDTSGHGDQATPLGYVNWNKSHYHLKKQHLVPMVDIRAAVKKLRTISMANMKPLTGSSKQVVKYNDQGYPVEEKKSENDLFLFKDLAPVVGKENRFPQDAVYVDVNSPQVQVEMNFMNKLFAPPTVGVVERFL